MFGGTLKAVAISAALAGVMGVGAGYRYAKGQFDTQAALTAVQTALEAERAETARLTVLLDLERDRATAADFARAEQQRVNREAAAREEAMEELIDELRATPGADDPAPPVIADALDRVLRTGSGARAADP